MTDQEYLDKIINLLKMPRHLLETEKKQILGWREYGMEDAVIYYAYEKTIIMIGKFSVPYMNTLIKNWHEYGLRTVDEVKIRCSENRSNKNLKQKNFYAIKVLNKNGEWYTNALIENRHDAVRVARFYREQLNYFVQLWFERKDVSFLIKE